MQFFTGQSDNRNRILLQVQFLVKLLASMTEKAISGPSSAASTASVFMYLVKLSTSPACQYTCSTATQILYQKGAVEDEQLYFTLLKMPLETSVFCILMTML